MVSKQIMILAGIFILLLGCTQTPGGGPTPPSGLAAQATDKGIVISWNPSTSADVTGYNVYASQTSGQIGNRINSGLVIETTFTDTAVGTGITYYYIVRAVDRQGIEEKNTRRISVIASNPTINTPTNVATIVPTQVNNTTSTTPGTNGNTNQTPTERVSTPSNENQFTTITNNPSSLSMRINNGASYTSSMQVILNVRSSDATQCRYSNDRVVYTEWETYQPVKIWILTNGTGMKTVYIQCQRGVDDSIMNASANIGIGIGSVTYANGSQATSSTINRTNDELYVSLMINNGDTLTLSRVVTLTTNAPSGVECRYGDDGTEYSRWEIYIQTRKYQLPGENGDKTVYVECKNSDGVVKSASASITMQASTSPGSGGGY